MKYFVSVAFMIVSLAPVVHAREYAVVASFDTILVNAFNLALETVVNNIENGIIKAGSDYGGEWTRDASINAWNAGSLIFPEESSRSLWAVTTDGGKTIGHQYWDKIIWVQGAFNHSMVTGEPIEKIYHCCAMTMKELEDTVYCRTRKLFRGPSVFNDGIAGYEYPIPESPVTRSNVLRNPNTSRIFCLSTNCIYYWAYKRLASMAYQCRDPFKSLGYLRKASVLRRSIRRNFYEKGVLNYLIDQNGDIHRFQEALGNSFAILSGVISCKEARGLLERMHFSNYGITSIYPDFQRFDRNHPGRHNNIVWPFVNAFWAEAALKSGDVDKFESEVRNLADLAMNKGGGMFYEVYNPYTGMPDGGWQLAHQWVSCRNQTWSATGYLRMILRGVFGLDFNRKGMSVSPPPYVAEDLGFTSLSGIRYRNHIVNISIKKADGKDRGIWINNRKVHHALVPCEGLEEFNIEFYR